MAKIFDECGTISGLELNLAKTIVIPLFHVDFVQLHALRGAFGTFLGPTIGHFKLTQMALLVFRVVLASVGPAPTKGLCATFQGMQ